MRTREEILENIKDNRQNYRNQKEALDRELLIEVLVDIRDLLAKEE